MIVKCVLTIQRYQTKAIYLYVVATHLLIFTGLNIINRIVVEYITKESEYITYKAVVVDGMMVICTCYT